MLRRRSRRLRLQIFDKLLVSALRPVYRVSCQCTGSVSIVGTVPVGLCVRVRIYGLCVAELACRELRSTRHIADAGYFDGRNGSGAREEAGTLPPPQAQNAAHGRGLWQGCVPKEPRNSHPWTILVARKELFDQLEINTILQQQHALYPKGLAVECFESFQCSFCWLPS